MTEIRAIDLFCGAGGSSWGASQGGVKIIAAFDKWSLAGKVYCDNFPETQFVEGDISSHEPKRLKRELGRVDMIIASPECTSHSPAKGAAQRCEKSRSTSFLIVKYLEVFNPRWVIIENVVSMRKWDRYKEFIDTLKRHQYHIRSLILNSADFGVPQSRRRLFILCDKEHVPPHTMPSSAIRKSARMVIDSNGAYPFTPLRSESRAKSTLERADRAISELGTEKDFLIVYYGSDQSGGWQSLDRPLRTVTTLDRFAYVRPSESGHELRMLQPEELKLAMGWPKAFRINHGTRRDKIRMIGNAVCPLVMQSIITDLCVKQLGAHT